MSSPLSFWQRVEGRLERWLDRRRGERLRAGFASCGRDVSVQWPVVVNGADRLRVGDQVSINAFVHIWANGGVTIGDGTLIGSHTAITSLTHVAGATAHADTLVAKPVVIGRNVWIGAHVVVLPGITIGDGAVVGAGAVVTRDVAAGAVVAGVPARPMAT